MKYSYAAAALAMATGAYAKPQITNGASIDPTEGKPFTVELTGCEKGCTVYLMQGPKDAAVPVKILSTSATDSATITLSNVGSGNYGLRVQDNSATGQAATDNANNDYSPIFSYTGTGPTSFPPLGSTATATSSSSRATSSSTDSDSTTTTDSSSTTATSSSSSTTGSSTTSSATKTTSSSSSKTSSTSQPTGTKPPGSAGNIVALSPVALIGAAAAAFFL